MKNVFGLLVLFSSLVYTNAGIIIIIPCVTHNIIQLMLLGLLLSLALLLLSLKLTQLVLLILLLPLLLLLLYMSLRTPTTNTIINIYEDDCF